MPKKINLPSKEDIVNYYITQGHSQKACAEYFGVSRDTFQRWCKIYDLTSSIDDRVKKIKATNLQKYGCEFPFQNQEIQNKVVDTVKNKYGVDNISKHPDIKAKIVSTLSAKYGDHYLDRANTALKQKYGVDIGSQAHLDHKTVEILNNENKMREFVLKNFKQKPSMTMLAMVLGCSDTAVFHAVKRLHTHDLFSMFRSQAENEIGQLLTSYGIAFKANERNKIGNHYELDFFCEKEKIAIEFNGTYWHSIEEKDKNYHFNKSLSAQESGIRLIHIYEYEWNDPIKRPIIISLLKIAFNINTNRIYARKCEIRKISNKEAKPFNEKNHLQGHRNAQITYGLFYNNELVQLMSFSKTKYNKNLKDDDSWEIIRGCPGSNNIVVGGVSKLFKHFIEENNPSSIFSYCDFNKFDGRGYEAIGMKFIGYTGPDMKWILPGWKVVERQPQKHQALKELSISQIWGAGSKKYLWTKSN